MSDSWHHARNLAARLQRELPEHAPVDGALSMRLERAVERALEKRRAGRVRRNAVVAVGAALALAAGAALVLRHEPTERVASPIARRPTPAPALLEGELFRVEAHAEVAETPLPVGAFRPDARHALRSGPSTVVQLPSGSRIELRNALVLVESFEKSAAFVLDSGAMGVDSLASGPSGQRVVVRAAETRIEATDAVFDVVRRSPSCQLPQLRVVKGVASVITTTGSRVVTAGTTWSGCDAVSTPAEVVSGSPPPRAAAAPVGTLQEQNDALAEAVGARRAGRVDEALRLYGRFLKRWPGGPLSEVARAERMGLLAGRDPSAARAAAKEYLRMHPNGPARDRAHTLATGGTK